MPKIDSKVIAAALASVEAMIEEVSDPAGIGASTLRIVVDEIGGSIQKEQPRFNTGEFYKAALPLQSERLKNAILKTLEGGA